MTNKEFRSTLAKLVVAAYRLHEDATNPKRMVTLGNLVDKLQEYSDSLEELDNVDQPTTRTTV